MLWPRRYRLCRSPGWLQEELSRSHRDGDGDVTCGAALANEDGDELPVAWAPCHAFSRTGCRRHPRFVSSPRRRRSRWQPAIESAARAPHNRDQSVGRYRSRLRRAIGRASIDRPPKGRRSALSTQRHALINAHLDARWSNRREKDAGRRGE